MVGRRRSYKFQLLLLSLNKVRLPFAVVTKCSFFPGIENWHKLDMSCGRVGGYMDDNDKDHIVVDSRNTIPNCFFVKTRFLFLDMVSNA